jgi:hypothetical protein
MKKMLTLKSILLLFILILTSTAFAAPTDHYRTKQSGNWSDIATWETSATGIAPWVAAGTAPDATANTITILNGHTVTVTASTNADQLTVNAGGKVSVNTVAVIFNILDGTGTDLTVDGVFSTGYPGGNSTYATTILNGNGTAVVNDEMDIINRGEFKINSGATLTIAATGSVVMSGGNGATRGTLTNMPGGNFTLTAGATITGNLALLNLNGTSTLNGTTSVMNNSDLVIGGTATLSSSITLGGQTGSGIEITNGGILDLIGTATIPMTGGNGAANGLTVDAGGTLKLKPSTLITSTLGGVFTLSSGGLIEVGATDGIAQTGSTGHVRTAAARTFSAGAHYTYNGVAPQITGTALPTVLTTGSLTINNATNANHVTLTNAVTTPTLNLTNGILNGVTNLRTTTIAVGGVVNRTNGWVYGNLAKNVALGAGVARNFEVGTAIRYNPMSVTFASVTTAGLLTVKVTAGDNPAVGNGSWTLNPNKTVNDYWTATNTGIVFTTYSATFNFNNPADLDPGVNTAALAVAKLNGGVWTYPAIGAQNATNTTGNNISSFSDFQLAEGAAGGPVPALYFRSAVTGNWNDANTWDYSPDGIAWTAAPAPHTPDFNDRTISIRTGHVVTVTADVTTDETIIDAGGTLNVNVANKLTINDGSNGDGFDLTINGILGGTGNVIITSNSLGTAAIGQSAGTVSNTNVTVQRYIPARRAWRFLAAPIVGAQTINNAWQEGAGGTNGDPNTGFGTHITGGLVADGFDQNAINNPSLKIYNNNNATTPPDQNNWAGIASTNLAITAQRGYMLFVRGSRANDLSQLTAAVADNTILRPTGSLYIGDKATAIAATGYTVVGNPYAAPINLNNLAKGNGSTGIADNFYVWDPKMTGTYGVGAYVNISWNGGGYTIAPAPTSPVSQYIQSGEAFFATQAVSGVAGNLIIKETDKNLTGSDNVFRVTSGSAPQDLRINLLVVMNDGSTNLLDGAVSSYSSIFANGIDKFDSRKLTNLNENIGIVSNGETFIVERKQAIGDPINLKIWQLFKQNYQIQVVAENIDANGLSAYVYDSYLKTSTPIDLNGTTTVNFTVNDDPASAASDRFTIQFAKQPVTVSGNAGISVFPNPVTNGNVNLRFNNLPAGVYTIRVFNSLGQAVINKQVTHTAGSSVETLRVTGKGMYQVEVTKPDNSKFSGKIIAN